MGLLDRFLKKKDAGNQLDAIWNMEDDADFVAALNEHIEQKCRYGEKMEALSGAERVFYITQTLEMEVNNGGFDQFFINSSGGFAGETVRAFEQIGALKTSAICKRAIGVFGGAVPSDRNERLRMLEDNDEIAAVLEECDDAFLEYEEDLAALNRAFVMRNREAFGK